MTALTLHKAGRLQEQVRAAIRALPLAPTVTLSIFAADPAGTVERAAGKLRDDLERLRRLLDALAAVRAAVGWANAESGISALLAEKAAIEEELALTARILPAEGARGEAKSAWSFLGRDRQAAAAPPETAALAEQLRAMRARYESGEGGGETTLDVPLLDEAERTRLRARLVERRRRLEEIADRLRELNGSVRVDINDDMLAWLREQEVI